MATENNIYCYDLRKPEVQDKVILNDQDYLYLFPSHKDEINQLSLSTSGNYLGVADDAGLATIYAIQRIDDLLHHDSERISMKPVSILTHSQQDNIVKNF